MEEKGKPQTFGVQMGTVGGMASKSNTATTVAPVTKAKKILPITIFTRTQKDGMNKEDAHGIPIGRQNDGACQQKQMNPKILLPIN